MKTREILDLDLDKKENVEKLQKVLKQIKPFSKVEGKVSLEMLEKFIRTLTVKYEIMIQYITPTFTDKIESMYSVSFKRTDSHVWLGNAYGKSIYELFAKICVKMYSDVKTLEIPERDWEKIKNERKKKMKELEEE